jgi:ubiquinone/menaquinone biosynthesis C-methylase UbiE
MSKSVWSHTSEAAKYAKSRPSHPQDIVNIAVQFLNEKYSGPLDQAVDVGCGTGISTCNLAGKFDQVLGVDASEAMVNEAREAGYPNSLTFQKASAEKLPVPDASVQLVLVGRAIHYFDTEAFYKELSRVLVDQGIVCYYSVHFPSVSCPGDLDFGAHVHKTFWSYLQTILKDYWSVNAYNNKTIDWDRRNYYVNVIPAPFKETRIDETVSVTRDISLIQLANELRTYSAFVLYNEREGAEKAAGLLDKFLVECLEGFENKDKEAKDLVATDNFFMVLSRK